MTGSCVYILTPKAQIFFLMVIPTCIVTFGKLRIKRGSFSMAKLANHQRERETKRERERERKRETLWAKALCKSRNPH